MSQLPQLFANGRFEIGHQPIKQNCTYMNICSVHDSGILVKTRRSDCGGDGGGGGGGGGCSGVCDVQLVKEGLNGTGESVWVVGTKVGYCFVYCFFLTFCAGYFFTFFREEKSKMCCVTEMSE